MTRYLRTRLERLQGRVGRPEWPETGGARVRMIMNLEAIAEARRNGTWTDEDATRLREAVRAARIRRAS